VVFTCITSLPLCCSLTNRYTFYFVISYSTLKERLKIYWQQHNPSTKCQEINNINITNVFTPKGKQFHHKSKYLLLTKFAVCTVSYGNKFFPSCPMQNTQAICQWGKNMDQWLTVRTEKMRLVRHDYFIISLRLIRWAGKERKLAWRAIK